MVVGFLGVLACALATGIVAQPLASTSIPLPVVDLGYVVQQATINDTGPYTYFNFSNIRYAAPPTGERRFTAPIAPTTINRTVNNGQQAVMCPQAEPAWLLTQLQYLAGVPLANLTPPSTASANANLNLSLIPPPPSTTSEDCLFLDVFVPQTIYNSQCGQEARGELAATTNATTSRGAPVLVWIYGGGYTAGSKSGSGSPATLLTRGRDNNQEGFIYVAMNYRLGVYGWLSGPTFQANGTANVGLYDQRLALEWVQTHIAQFGGDPTRVTVIGESAGAGSIMHQIMAYGGNKGPAPFHQAILQSPGFSPINLNTEEEAVYTDALQVASLVAGKAVTTVEQLRNLTAVQLYQVNYILVGSAPYGSFTFGPSVDGNFVPQLPGLLLLHGQYDKTLNIMLGHNLNEGLLFTNPFILNETAFDAYLTLLFPAASAPTLTYISQVLYPPIFNGSLPYTTYTARVALLTSELVFTCNTRYLDTAYMNATYSYYFTVPPGLHGEDIAYTYFNGDTTTSDDGLPVNATVARALQDYLTSFAMTGTPNEPGVPVFPAYGANATTTNLGLTNLGGQVPDTTANARCAYWQKALYS